jgi:progressive ankylosis protein
MLSLRKILVFWIPLSATWIMMSVEGPFLAAIIARLPEPKYNLAAYGVAYAIALMVEAPIIMIMSATTALVHNRETFLKLQRFIYTLNIIITSVMLILLLPFVFNFFTQKLIGLPQDVSRLTHQAVLILLPWPGAIGYRRFYQGILIRCNLTRRVAYGTVVRLLAMSTTALVFYKVFQVNGVIVGAASLSSAVTLEAIACRFMARQAVNSMLTKNETEDSPEQKLTYLSITRFYYPLALTSMLGLGVQPLVTFFLGHSRLALESLAAFPVVNSLVFLFRGLGLSYQEVGVALLGKKNENYLPLRNFALILGISVITILSLIAYTPLSAVWYLRVSGLSPEMVQIAILPTRILAILPGLTVLLTFQRSLLVNNKKTAYITFATAIEVFTIIMILFLTTRWLNVIGIIAAAVAMLTGRLLANCYLFVPYFRILKKQK